MDKKIKEIVNMNLAEKIFNERTKLDLSQEQFAEQMGVSRQAVSKWETGQSLPDLDKLVMMSRVFGVSTDYLLGEETGDSLGEQAEMEGARESRNVSDMESMDRRGVSDGEFAPRYITDEEAEEYCRVRKKFGKRIGLGVALCIMGLALTHIVEYVVQETMQYRVNDVGALEDMSAVPFLLLVAIAVALFIVSGLSMGKYEFMEKTNLALSADMTKRLQEESERRYRVFTAKIAAGVSLCIIGALICVIFEILENATESAGLLEGMGAFFLLLIVAVAVYLFVTAGIEKSTYDILLQKNGHRLQIKEKRRQEEENKTFKAVSGIYWCIITAVYLAYSFITFDWGSSWIVWPVAGCLFGAVKGVFNLLNRDR